MIRAILDRGYSLRSFHDVEAASQHLVLRHDIDQSIAIARELAEAEAAEGWHSTWFVLVRTDMYNPLSPSNAAHMKAMIASGHEIGLHLDATCYDGENALQKGAQTECSMLEDVLGQEVRIISFHRPAQHLIGGDLRLAGRLNTYMDRFVKDMGYCSDSRGQWRFGPPAGHKALAERRALQLLTHAIWWVGPDGRDPLGRIQDLIAAKMREYDTELAANVEIWRPSGSEKS